MKLDEKLVYLRKEKGLTQLELAETLNISRQAVSRWEVGTALPSIDNLICLCKLYEVPSDYLLNDNMEYPIRPEPTEEKASEPREKYKTRNLKQYVIAAVCAVILFAAALLAYWEVINKNSDSDNVPIGEMTREQWVSEPDGTFSITW